MFTYEQGNLVQGLPPQQPVASQTCAVFPSCHRELCHYCQTGAEVASASLCGEFGISVITDNTFAVAAAQNMWWFIVANGYFSAAALPINCGCTVSHWA